MFGETGLEGETFNYLVGAWASHPYYLMGWVASGIAVYGDIRDLIYNIHNEDTIGAGIIALGLVPVLGDCEKTAADVGIYVMKYPHLVLDVSKYLFETHILSILPDGGQLNIIDNIYLFSTGRRVGTELATNYGLSASQVGWIASKVKLSQVIHVTKVGGDVVPWRQDRIVHYNARHVDGTEGITKYTSFFPTSEPVIRITTDTGASLPNPGISSLTRDEMKNKVMQWAEDAITNSRTEWKNINDEIRYSPPEARQYGIDEIVVMLNEDIGVGTVFPSKGPQVFAWDGKMWRTPGR